VKRAKQTNKRLGVCLLQNCPSTWSRVSWVHLFKCSSNRHLLNTYCMPGIVLGIWQLQKINRMHFPPWSSRDTLGTSFINLYLDARWRQIKML
jgi:hypothetical protein